MKGCDGVKSIKKGRGPSFRGGVGSVFMAIFGVLWTVAAASMTGGMGVIGIIFPLFGLVFIGIAVFNALYEFKNAASKNRYSEYDIVDENEESDPLNERFGGENAFCPYCGIKINDDFEYCPKCGKKLPEVKL